MCTGPRGNLCEMCVIHRTRRHMWDVSYEIGHVRQIEECAIDMTSSGDSPTIQQSNSLARTEGWIKMLVTTYYLLLSKETSGFGQRLSTCHNIALSTSGVGLGIRTQRSDSRNSGIHLTV